MLSYVQLFATPWTISRQAPLSMKFSRQEYWRGLPFPTLGNLLDQEIELMFPTSPALVGGFFTTVSPGQPAQVDETKTWCGWLRGPSCSKVGVSLLVGGDSTLGVLVQVLALTFWWSWLPVSLAVGSGYPGAGVGPLVSLGLVQVNCWVGSYSVPSGGWGYVPGWLKGPKAADLLVGRDMSPPIWLV